MIDDEHKLEWLHFPEDRCVSWADSFQSEP